MKFFFLFIFFSSCLNGQVSISKDFFRLPLDIPMQLSGNFGELRPNHFHAGFDFKTNQKEGLNVYATADGYISRIKISNSGYGKAIYITHNNGFTSVYGHLQKAVGKIQDKIIQEQYLAKNYEIETYLKPGEIEVLKGEIIAVSGNTGGSEGPHLHFEIRDNKTEKTINPLSFGFDLKDTKKPVVSSLLVYPIDETTIVNQSKRPISLNLSLQEDGTYLAESVKAVGRIGFGVNTYDNDDVSYNPNGIYKIEVFANGKSIFGYEFDTLIFDEARYVNAIIDYSKYKKTYQRVQKLFMKNSFDWSNIKSNIENGISNVIPNFAETQRIEVSDFNGNKTIISIPISYSAETVVVQNDIKKTDYLLKSKIDNLYEKDNWSISFPAKTFYDDFYLNFDVKNNVLILHEDTVPAHTNFLISAFDNTSSEIDKKKMFIASTYNGKLNYINTFLKENTFSCKTKTLGQFTLAKDTIAPKIIISKSIQNKDISNQKEIRFTISDDFSGIKTINGYLNEKWILFEYESKLKRIIHTFDDSKLVEGLNTLKLLVVDNVGNSSTFETQFTRSIKK